MREAREYQECSDPGSARGKAIFKKQGDYMTAKLSAWASEPQASGMSPGTAVMSSSTEPVVLHVLSKVESPIYQRAALMIKQRNRKISDLSKAIRDSVETFKEQLDIKDAT